MKYKGVVTNPEDGEAVEIEIKAGKPMVHEPAPAVDNPAMSEAEMVAEDLPIGPDASYDMPQSSEADMLALDYADAHAETCDGPSGCKCNGSCDCHAVEADTNGDGVDNIDIDQPNHVSNRASRLAAALADRSRGARALAGGLSDKSVRAASAMATGYRYAAPRVASATRGAVSLAGALAARAQKMQADYSAAQRAAQRKSAAPRRRNTGMRKPASQRAPKVKVVNRR